MSDIISGKARSNTSGNKVQKSGHSAQSEILSEQIGAQDNGHLKKLSISQTYRSGPLPAVEEFAGYESIHNGAAGKILDMAMSAQKHRQWIEKWDQFFDFILRLIGILSVATLIAGVIYVTYQAAISDHPVLSGIFGTSGILAIGGSLRHYLLQKNNPLPQQQKTSRKQNKTKPSF